MLITLRLPRASAGRLNLGLGDTGGEELVTTYTAVELAGLRLPRSAPSLPDVAQPDRRRCQPAMFYSVAAEAHPIDGNSW